MRLAVSESIKYGDLSKSGESIKYGELSKMATAPIQCCNYYMYMYVTLCGIHVCTFCDHWLLSTNPTSRCVPYIDDAAPPLEPESTFNFVTHCFFLTHKSLTLGWFTAHTVIYHPLKYIHVPQTHIIYMYQGSSVAFTTLYIHVYTCTYFERTKQSNSTLLRKSFFQRKSCCLRWDSNPRHSAL